MKLLRKLFRKKYCNNCFYYYKYYNKEVVNRKNENYKKINSTLTHFIKSLTEYNEKLLFFDDNFNSDSNNLLCVTSFEKYDYKGIVKEITIKGYNKDYILGYEEEPQYIFIEPYQRIIADRSYLQYFYIQDIRCIPNKGYGSIMMKSLIDYAQRFEIEYISGFLSPVDTSDPEHNDRLRHFYKKFRFTISSDDRIRLDFNSKQD